MAIEIHTNVNDMLSIPSEEFCNAHKKALNNLFPKSETVWHVAFHKRMPREAALKNSKTKLDQCYLAAAPTVQEILELMPLGMVKLVSNRGRLSYQVSIAIPDHVVAVFEAENMRQLADNLLLVAFIYYDSESAEGVKFRQQVKGKTKQVRKSAVA